MAEYYVAVNRHIIPFSTYAEACKYYELFSRIRVTRALASRRQLPNGDWVGCELIRRSWDWVSA